MQVTRTFKMISLAAMLATAFGASAATSGGWAATQTLAHDTGSAVRGYAMLPGELVQVALSLELRNESKLDALVEAIATGKSQQYLTPAAFMRDHAPTDAQVKAVVDHLQKSGFVNVAVSDNHMLVTADGSAATVKLAFNTELSHFSVDGRDAYANVSDAVVPSALSGIVKAVLGLQTIDVSHTMIQPAKITTATSTGHSPTQFPAIYNATGLPAATGATIGIISDGNMSQTLLDLTAFVAQAGFPTPNVSTVIVGSAGTDTSGTPEWDLDSQDALSAAGGQIKKLVFYVANSLSDSALTAAYNQVLSDTTVKVINVSLGECERSAKTSGVIATDDAIFKTAVAQGQTFSVSTGDSGSYECGGKRTSYQSYPAVSPYVIAAGGTTLSTTNGVYAGETVWSGTGGGASTTETAPSWQKASGVLGTATSRGVPDIAFDADPNSGSIIIVNGKSAQYGGTSLAAPLFAGFWTRVQAANPGASAFPASALYQFGPTNASVFHDITSGSNGGYSAKAGWDYTTGFGSLNVGVFSAFVATHAGY